MGSVRADPVLAVGKFCDGITADYHFTEYLSMFGRKVKRLVRRRVRRTRSRHSWTAAEKQHYADHKEAARALCHERLAYWNTLYNLSYNRVSIRNTRSRWGSCSSKRNLNFNYRILFLPPELQDYLIVHELCHLQEMNHAAGFWSLVAQQIPDYKARVRALKTIEKDLFTRAIIIE